MADEANTHAELASLVTGIVEELGLALHWTRHGDIEGALKLMVNVANEVTMWATVVAVREAEAGRPIPDSIEIVDGDAQDARARKAREN